jgi:hypothetical protein
MFWPQQARPAEAVRYGCPEPVVRGPELIRCRNRAIECKVGVEAAMRTFGTSVVGLWGAKLSRHARS